MSDKHVYTNITSARTLGNIATTRVIVVRSDNEIRSLDDLRVALEQGQVDVGYQNVSVAGWSEVYFSYQQAIEKADSGQL
jgi:hypothetical protein